MARHRRPAAKPVEPEHDDDQVDEHDQGDDEHQEPDEQEEPAAEEPDGRQWPEVQAWNAANKGTWRWPTQISRPKPADVGWFGVGMIGYALAMSLIRYGPTGPKAWFMAKFLNKPVPGLESTRIGGTDRSGIPT